MIPPRIQSYHFGNIVIDEKTYNKDVIILPDRVLPNWWRRSGHILHRDDLLAIFQSTPELLIIGQGASSQMKVPNETQRELENQGIDWISLPTEQACQRYNELRDEQKVAAALHLTC